MNLKRKSLRKMILSEMYKLTEDEDKSYNPESIASKLVSPDKVTADLKREEKGQISSKMFGADQLYSVENGPVEGKFLDSNGLTS